MEVRKWNAKNPGKVSLTSTAKKGESSSSSCSGEKPKWVQIPPSELQATADALQARSQPAHSRNQSQHGRYNNTRNQTTSTGGSSSGSVVVSRRSSRAQSVHSRTGSVQASPRHFPRPKLPAETDTSAENRSGANSPAPSMNFRSPYSDAPGINYSSGQASGYDIFPLIPEQQIRPHSFERTGSPSQSTYYSGVNTNTSRPTTESPTAPQDHLVGSTNHADPYFYGTKYTHWTGSSTSHHLDRNKQMQSTLQTSNPSNAKDGHIPPPMTSRSPPHEEALGGYPDVASALSSAEDAGGVNGGGIVRNMVFGSIEPQGSCQESRSTTPEPKATTLVSNEDAVVVEQKAFPAFSIGILPNEVERARTRSKARKQGNTRSSSATAEVNGGNLEPPGPVIDSTESKWEFGTTKHLDADTLSSSPGNGTNDPVASCPPASKTAVALDRRRSEGGDEWEVRDFGYGFGSMSGTGRAPAVVREERLAREKQRERERQERERERELERDRDRESENYFELGRPRRGSLVGIPDRGGSVPRRGRGNFGSRNFSRGYHGHPRQPLPFTATPPQHFQQLSSHGYSPEPQNAAYYVPQPNFTPYGVGYDVYAYAPYHQPPAVAAPLSSVAFPLDPTRYYLLCQLEYYLSPQNMAQDFFLRQQVSRSSCRKCHKFSTALIDGSTWLDFNPIVSLVQSCETGDNGRPTCS
jgi:la-related protein 1